METHPSSSETTSMQSNDYTLLFYLRIIFYILFALRLLEIVFKKNRKPNIKQRIERKFLFAHGEMLKNFDKEDVETMHETLFNTFKNATQPMKTTCQEKKLKKSKTVSFTFENNKYYDPPKFQGFHSAIFQESTTKASLTPGQEKVEEIQKPIIEQILGGEESKVDEETPLIVKREEEQLCQNICI